MHSALFISEIVSRKTDWDNFLANVSIKLRKYPSVLRLAENVWLLNIQESVAPLAHLVSFAEAAAIPYGLLQFERAPEWLPGGFDPKTIQVRNVDS